MDLGSTHLTGIHVVAYTNLCRYLGIKSEPLVFTDVIQQLVLPSEQVLNRFDVDTRGLFPLCSHNWNVRGKDIGPCYEYRDEWGFTHHFPKHNGLYWSLAKSPMPQQQADKGLIENYPWPEGRELERIEGLRKTASDCRQAGKIVVVKSICAGLFEMGQRFRGMENFLCDLIVDKTAAHLLLDKILEVKKRYWAMVIEQLGDLVDIVAEADDYGTQQSQLISLDTYHQMFEPRLQDLMKFLRTTLNRKKTNGEKAYIFFHSCGNIRPFLPSFIAMGINIINPVHITAAGMEPQALKADFGDKITFWGGGVESQHVLPRGTPEEVKKNVRRCVESMKANGGFVFNTVHNIQADVPPRNIVAMWEAFHEAGAY